MRDIPAIGAIINSDKARRVRRRTIAVLDVFNDDLDAYLASWEDFHRGGPGRWYDTKRRDIYDLDVLEQEQPDAPLYNADPPKEQPDEQDHEAGDDLGLLD